jgi:hypothetical protein
MRRCPISSEFWSSTIPPLVVRFCLPGGDGVVKEGGDGSPFISTAYEPARAAFVSALMWARSRVPAEIRQVATELIASQTVVPNPEHL